MVPSIFLTMRPEASKSGWPPGSFEPLKSRYTTASTWPQLSPPVPRPVNEPPRLSSVAPPVPRPLSPPEPERTLLWVDFPAAEQPASANDTTERGKARAERWRRNKRGTPGRRVSDERMPYFDTGLESVPAQSGRINQRRRPL